MDSEKDHYSVLGLPSGEDGSKLTEKEISKAYKLKALELHPDKRPDDPNSHDNFHALKFSYEILKDEKKRKDFDDNQLSKLRVNRERQFRDLQSDSKRKKMFSDLEERERAAFKPNQATKTREKEDVIDRKNKEIYDRIARDIQNKAGPCASTVPLKKKTAGASTSAESVSFDKSKMLKVSWEKGGIEYTSEKLKEIFTKFGMVEDVVMKKSSKRGSALVVMVSKDAAVAATGCVCGDLSNPLLVLPLQPFMPTMFQIPKAPVEPVNVNKPVGMMGFQNFEDSVLEKLRKAAERENCSRNTPSSN